MTNYEAALANFLRGFDPEEYEAAAEAFDKTLGAAQARFADAWEDFMTDLENTISGRSITRRIIAWRDKVLDNLWPGRK